MKENSNVKQKRKTSKKIVVQKSNEELLEEIMQRKRERKAKKDLKNTIKIDKLKEIEKEDTKDNEIDKTKIIDNKEIKKLEVEQEKNITIQEEIQNTQELEKTKVLPPQLITEITETIDISEIIKLQNRNKFKIFIIIPVIVVLITILLFIFLHKDEVLTNEIEIEDIIVNSYDDSKEIINVSVLPSKKQSKCAISENIVEDLDLLEFKEVVNGTCDVLVQNKPYYVYFMNEFNIVSDALELNNYLVRINIDENYYVTPGTPVDLGEDIVAVGDVNIIWSSLDGVIEVQDNIYVNNEVAKMQVFAMANEKKVASTNIYTTNVITNMPMEYDTKKPYLSCKQFTHEEAVLLDEIFFDRIKKAGEGTRAGAVAAARFLTLEFPYRITYYHENGRVNSTGVHFVDGEGRYYHKGLYLDEAKYEDIQASFFGPAMWGCKMVTYEDDPPWFVPGYKYPNGFDCSGFVSWALYNGGFDVGDYGAGQSEGRWDLTDYGDVESLTPQLINSGRIKVGDLFNYWGHISILVGITDTHFYIAESLQPYGGLVVRKYNKRTVNDEFPYVVLMDKLYEGDGNLTDMWY